MARIYCLLIILTFPVVACAQVKVSASVGYGTYSMKDLKEHQEQLKEQFPVDPKITSSFPGYWYYQFGASYRFKSNFFIGSSVSYGSTGGKIHYQDYSGEIGCEHKVKYISVGVPLGWQFPIQQDKMNLGLELSPALYFGNTQLAFETEVNTQSDQQSVEFESINIGLQPAARLERQVGPVLIFIQAGYYIDVYRSELTVKDNSEYYLLNGNGKKVHSDFTGLRTALGVAFAFPH